MNGSIFPYADRPGGIGGNMADRKKREMEMKINA